MPIYNCVIHFAEKKADGSAASLQLAQQPLSGQETCEALLLEFNQQFNAKPGKAMGFLRTDSALAQQLPLLIQQPEQLLQLSRQLAEKWQQSIQNDEIFIRSHLCFMHYSHSMSDFLAVALVPQSLSLGVDQELALEQVRHLDLAQMQLAARINLNEWHNNPQSRHHISWLKARGGKKLLQAFTDLLGCEESEDAPAQTHNLLQAFTDYVAEAELSQDSAKEKTDTLVRLANQSSKAGRPLALDELSEELDEDNPQAFYQHIRNKDYGLSDYVPTDRRTLSQFQRFSGRAEGMSISFEAHLLGSRVEYDRERDCLIIRNPPTQLKDQIQRNQ